MATHAPVARVPFAPLDNPRLQHLASAKNRQNGLSKSILGGKANITPSKSVASPTKRPLDLSTFDDYDSENIDPATFSSPSKKSKSHAFEKPATPFTFSLTPAKAMPPPPTIPSRVSTPIRANMSSPRNPMTAPAGRSPKRKAAGVNKTRRVSAPFTRIDPPFASRGSSLPFSLDAALSGTFSSSTPKSAGATIQESMPKSWFFEIYEDTPEEEAANLMEHSTLTLDLSSHDEGSKSERDDRGKENCPPEGYDAPTASRSAGEGSVAAAPKFVKKCEIVRVKVASEKMDDGEREPLSDLETEPFIPEGLTRESCVVVQPTPERSASVVEGKEVAPFTAGLGKKASSGSVVDAPVVDEGKVKGDIIVWEDKAEVEESVGSEVESEKGVVVADENAAPV